MKQQVTELRLLALCRIVLHFRMRGSRSVDGWLQTEINKKNFVPPENASRHSPLEVWDVQQKKESRWALQALLPHFHHWRFAHGQEVKELGDSRHPASASLLGCSLTQPQLWKAEQIWTCLNELEPLWLLSRSPQCLRSTVRALQRDNMLAAHLWWIQGNNFRG